MSTQDALTMMAALNACVDLASSEPALPDPVKTLTNAKPEVILVPYMHSVITRKDHLTVNAVQSSAGQVLDSLAMDTCATTLMNARQESTIALQMQIAKTILEVLIALATRDTVETENIATTLMNVAKASTTV